MPIRRLLNARGAKTSAFVTLMMSPVIGMMYLNKGRLALVYLGVTLALILLDEVLANYNVKDYEIISLCTTLALYLVACVHTYRIAKAKTYELPFKWFSRFSSVLSLITLYVMVAILLIVPPVRSFLYEPYHIPSGSMLPALQIEDYILADKGVYGYSRYSLPFHMNLWQGRIFGAPPQRGDIVVFALPSAPKIAYVKRVIGVGGDTVRLIDGIVYLNGAALEQKEVETTDTMRKFIETLPSGKTYYIYNDKDDEPLDNTPLYTIPKGYYFMMGDNRDHSQDSRAPDKVGFVHEDFLIGKAAIRFYNAKTGAVTFEPVEKNIQ